MSTTRHLERPGPVFACRPFVRSDAAAVAAHGVIGPADAQSLDAFEEHGGVTATRNGIVIGCGGMVRIWPGRALAWAMLAPSRSTDMIYLFRCIDDYLNHQPVRRIEAHVDANFEAGQRMVAMLRFRAEATMQAFMPDGSDAVLWARVNRNFG